MKAKTRKILVVLATLAAFVLGITCWVNRKFSTYAYVVGGPLADGIVLDAVGVPSHARFYSDVGIGEVSDKTLKKGAARMRALSSKMGCQPDIPLVFPLWIRHESLDSYLEGDLYAFPKGEFGSSAMVYRAGGVFDVSDGVTIITVWGWGADEWFAGKQRRCAYEKYAS